MDSLEMIDVAVNELTNPVMRLDREANKPPALLYHHLRECIAKEPHIDTDPKVIPW
jgi:hypothetical protein